MILMSLSHTQLPEECSGLFAFLTMIYAIGQEWAYPDSLHYILQYSVCILSDVIIIIIIIMIICVCVYGFDAWFPLQTSLEEMTVVEESLDFLVNLLLFCNAPTLPPTY